ncbi:MAG TPA: hypothetical protein VGX52_07175 [Burkholderiales bacterium]|nr:hypothetical protein [Burkholderiales bacterium]
MNETGPAITRYGFTSGMLRGTHLTLHPTCLVHRSDNHLETLPLAGITALRVAFQRDTRKLGWGIALIVIALLLLAIAGPIGSFASGAAGEMATAGAQGVARALHGFFRLLEAVASLLPVLALACVIGGGALCALGWMGSTMLLVSLPGSERLYATRGRDSMLLDFAEALSERLMLLKR